MSRRLALPFVLLLAGACGKERDPGQWPIAPSELTRDGSPSAGPTGDGEATFQRFCVGCHGADGKGNGGTTGADFTGPGSPLARHTDAELATSVRDGKRGERATMPAHSPVLSDAQIGAVVSYLRARFQAAAPSP
jgi:mono/diheme cytochrome c family protein